MPKCMTASTKQAGFDGGGASFLSRPPIEFAVGAERLRRCWLAPGRDDEDAVALVEGEIGLLARAGRVGAEAEDDAAGPGVERVATRRWGRAAAPAAGSMPTRSMPILTWSTAAMAKADREARERVDAG